MKNKAGSSCTLPKGRPECSCRCHLGVCNLICSGVVQNKANTWPAPGILSNEVFDYHKNNAVNKANKATMKNKADVHNDFRTMNNFEENINNNIHQEQHGPGGTQNAGINCGGRNRKNKAIFNDFRTINTHTKNVNNNVRQIQYGPGGTQNAGIGC